MPKTIPLHIFRYDREEGDEGRFDTFRVPLREGMTVQQALFYVQQNLDPSLAFRFSCRGAVCGSCAMVINGLADLACRTQIAKLRSDEILVEPLPNLEILRDLIVDMEPFWEKYRRVEPWLHALDHAPERERRMTEEERAVIDPFVNCILCACCYGSCPVLGRDPDYVGPAALAHLFRFEADVRDQRPRAFLSRFDTLQGLWGCDTILRCVDGCPKSVRPVDGIEALRRRAVVHRVRSVLGGKR